MKGWCLKSVNKLELLTVLEALPQTGYLKSSGYLILSNFELREHILRRDGASSDRIQRETSTFRKKAFRSSHWLSAAHIPAKENVRADGLPRWGYSLHFLRKFVSLSHFHGVG